MDRYGVPPIQGYPAVSRDMDVLAQSAADTGDVIRLAKVLGGTPVSRTMRVGLAMLGIRHQRTELHCPWQNGRIERFFGTLKDKLDHVVIADGDDLRCKLIEFRCWYNHVRLHQHLHYRTPAEAWADSKKSTRRPTRFSAWDGRLTGWYFGPS